uniref:hypothetical protein n=1 Tax=Cellvibrio fontiphilus TaxID=1815559 RepID=UPI002B4C017F|nr:hypothetical protein [Cellvibrio fontiphilus]
MADIPRVRMVNAADKYQKSSEFLNDNAIGDNQSFHDSACLIAALSLEIYLKSFLSERETTELDSGSFLVSEKVVRGHNLLELYNRIPAEIKNHIVAFSREIDPSIDFLESLERYKDYFCFSRYPYEGNIQRITDSEIVSFSYHMGLVTKKVAKIIRQL